MKLSNIFPLLFFFVLALVLAYTTDLSSKANFVPSMIGHKVEAFEMEDLTTGEKFTNEDFKTNGITVINLFASWCVSCKAEHEVIKSLAEKEGLVVYGINVADTKEAALKYLSENGNPYKKIGFDPRQKMAISMGATGVPETFVVDKDGVIFFHQRSLIDESTVKRTILPIIEGMKKKK